MYIFQLKLTSYYGGRKESFSFPHKPPKKYGTTHIDLYKSDKDGLGWFKTKRLEDAEKGFIKKLKKTMAHAQKESTSNSTSTNQSESYIEDLKFLDKVMAQTLEKYGDVHPEMFI